MFISTAIAATTEAAEHGGGGSFPPFDSSTFASQLFWLAITFGIFYWLMGKVLAPRISDILETRQSRIADDIDKAHEFKEQADNAIAAYEQELATAKANANEIATKARDKAKAEAEAERASVEAELAEKLATSEAQIAKTRASAMAEVGTIAEETTAAILDQLIGAKATKADLAKAIKAPGS